MGSEQEIVRIGRQLEKIANSDTPVSKLKRENKWVTSH